MQKNSRVRPVDPAQALAAGLADLGLSLSSGQQQQLLEHLALVEKWNAAFNLVSRKDVDRLVLRHAVDSLSVVPWISGARILDVGSGAGFPGVPVAVALPHAKMVLCERLSRRARFLHQVVNQLGLASVTVTDADVAQLGDGRWDTVLARGVAAPATIWNMVEPFLEEYGKVFVFASTRAPAAHAELPAGAVGVEREVRLPGLEMPHRIVELQRA